MPRACVGGWRSAEIDGWSSNSSAEPALRSAPYETGETGAGERERHGRCGGVERRARPVTGAADGRGRGDGRGLPGAGARRLPAGGPGAVARLRREAVDRARALREGDGLPRLRPRGGRDGGGGRAPLQLRGGGRRGTDPGAGPQGEAP